MGLGGMFRRGSLGVLTARCSCPWSRGSGNHEMLPHRYTTFMRIWIDSSIDHSPGCFMHLNKVHARSSLSAV